MCGNQAHTGYQTQPSQRKAKGTREVSRQAEVRTHKGEATFPGLEKPATINHSPCSCFPSPAVPWAPKSKDMESLVSHQPHHQPGKEEKVTMAAVNWLTLVLNSLRVELGSEAHRMGHDLAPLI